MRRLDRTAETSHDLAVIALYIVQDNPSAATDWSAQHRTTHFGHRGAAYKSASVFGLDISA